MTLLEVNDLSIAYDTKEGQLEAVDDVSFVLNGGETLGIVGESGCGKSTAVKSILGLLDSNGTITGGEILYKGTDLAQLSEKELDEQIRWKEISMIPQNAMNALDPVYRVGRQFREVIRAHTDVTKQEADERTAELLEGVGLDANRMHDYPHELSGGQRQRVVIALALALEPSIIVSDECTTGLDVIVQDEILTLITDIQERTGNAMMFITHDIGAVAEVSDRIAVMYGGHVVEEGTIRDVFKQSGHPYTIGLRQAFPSLGMTAENLISIPGSPPSLIEPPTGCRFAARCPFATDECSTEPELMQVERSESRHVSKCHYADRAAEFRQQSDDPDTWEEESNAISQ